MLRPVLTCGGLVAATLVLSRAESSLAGALVAIVIVQLASMLLGRGDERRGALRSGLGVARGPYLSRPITAVESSGGAVDSKAVERLGPISFGVASMQGWRSHMEDAHCLCAELPGPGPRHHALVGVFDGHGGDFAAQFASSQLVPVLIETKEWRRYRTLRMRAARCRRAARRTAIAHSGGGAHEGHDDDDDYEEEEAEDADVPSRSAAGPSVEREAAVKAGDGSDGGAAAAASSAAASEAATEAEDAAANALGTALQHAFIDLDERLRAACHDRSGATACVAVVSPTHIVVANAGDSRCVLARTAPDVPRAADGAAASAVAGADAAAGARPSSVTLSRDHKPTDADEHARIIAAGGRVVLGRVDGVLNLSRALGDFQFKSTARLGPRAQRVTAWPEVRARRRAAGDELLVIGCDGVWDVVSSDLAAAFLVHARNATQPGGQLAKRGDTGPPSCERLARLLVEASFRNGSHDNITAVVVGGISPPAAAAHLHHTN